MPLLPKPKSCQEKLGVPFTGEGRGLLVRSCVGQSRIGTGEPTSLALRTEKASLGMERWLHKMLKCWSHKNQDLSSIPHEAEHTLAVSALWSRDVQIPWAYWPASHRLRLRRDPWKTRYRATEE